METHYTYRSCWAMKPTAHTAWMTFTHNVDSVTPLYVSCHCMADLLWFLNTSSLAYLKGRNFTN